MIADEHIWHACSTPPPPDNTPVRIWHCPTCQQWWTWTRPPRPPAQWTRTNHEEL